MTHLQAGIITVDVSIIALAYLIGLVRGRGA